MFNNLIVTSDHVWMRLSSVGGFLKASRASGGTFLRLSSSQEEAGLHFLLCCSGFPSFISNVLSLPLKAHSFITFMLWLYGYEPNWVCAGNQRMTSSQSSLFCG